MRVRDVFRLNIQRPIEEVIKVDLAEEAIVAAEIEEYVVTDHIRESLEELADAYQETILNKSQKTTVWVSGFFGSGKSSFAKTFGYLLANPMVSGRPAAERILERVGSKKLEAVLATARSQAPAVSVYLDLSTGQNVMAEGESMVLPMYRALLERLGYARNIVLAELEFSLEGDGELQRFEDAFEQASGKKWLKRRDVLLAKNEASKALHDLRPDTYPFADSWAKSFDTPEINHNWFATRALDLLARRGGGAKRLIFIVDEVGQYVSRSIDRVLALSGVAEAFQKKQGDLWFVVTSQERLEEVVDSLDSKKTETARAKDRFANRVDLLPSDISEVASRRVLDKTEEGRRILREMFRAHRNRLSANVRLESAGRDIELGEEDFIRLYPIVPYQVNLLIDAVSARRAQGAGSSILGGSNRTIIKLAQQLVTDRDAGLGNEPVGALVTVDAAGQLLQSILPTAWQGEIDEVSNRHGLDSDETRLMRTVALTSDVKALPATVPNLTAMLHPRIDADSRRGAIQQALNVLVAEDRMRLGDDGYQIQSPQQKDWEKLRRGKEPTPAEALRIRKSLLRQALTGLSATKGRVFKVEVWVEGERVNDGEVALHIDEAPPQRRDELRPQSREQEARHRVTWLFALGDDTYDAVVELHRSNEMIRIKDVPSKAQADMELLGQERRRQSDAESRVLDRLTRDLASGQILFRGELDDVPQGLGLVALGRRIVEDRILSIYPRLLEFAAPVDGKLPLKLLRSDDLRGLPEALYDDGIQLIRLTPGGYKLDVDGGPLADLLAEINQRTGYGQIVSGALLEKEFAKPERGASLEVVELLAAAGFRAGELDVTHQGARIAAATDARLDKVFGTIPAFRAASFAPAKDADDVPLETRVTLAMNLGKLSGSRPPHDIAGLARELRRFFDPDIAACASVSSGLRGAGLPVPEAVINTQNVVGSIKSASDGEVIMTMFGGWVDLIAGREVAHRLLSTLDEDLALYRTARDTLAPGSAGLSTTALDEFERLRELIATGDIHGRRGEIAGLASRVSDARRLCQTALAQRIAERIKQVRRDVRERFADVDTVMVDESLRTLDALDPGDDAENVPVDVLQSRVAVVDARAIDVDRELAQRRADGRLVWVDVRTVVPQAIESEDQLDPALQAIREAVEKQLAASKQVRLQ